MPQMMPMMWSFTITYMFMYTLMIIYFIYFFKSMLTSFPPKKMNNFNHWTWKW